MVSFSCETCGDVFTKKKLDPHRNRCRGATFTCIDCMTYFPGVQYRSHTSCMTEDQKYQGALYKDKSKKQKQNQNQNQNQAQTQTQTHNNNTAVNQPANSRHITFDDDTYDGYDNSKAMVRAAYVEDCYEDREYDWNQYAGQTDDAQSPAEPPPEAPTPPSAHDDHVNVFDFMIASGQTPNASNLNLNMADDSKDDTVVHSTSLVRYEPKDDEFVEQTEYADETAPLVEYGSDPVQTEQFVTPVSKHERRKHRDSDVKKDKKRKHLHVNVSSDRVMTDAPPMLHTGLTGSINRMMRPEFPPSPDYSGNDAPEPSPVSPLKKSKSKHSKHSHQVSHSLFSMIAGPPKTKSKSKSKTKAKKNKTSSKKHSHHHKESKAPKLIEYRPHTKEELAEAGESQMILFKPRADVFLSFIDKGPESERGCSMNKALKRFHREREEAAGTKVPKGAEEKELWRSLRLRRNEQGEIVLFSI